MILDELYLCNSEKTPPSPEYREVLRKMEPYQEKIKNTLGFPFLDEYSSLNIELADIAERQNFHSGVQFAIRFLLESLL